MKGEVVTLDPATDAGRWDAFVERSPQGAIFNRSWYLGVVADRFDLLAFLDPSGVIRAGCALPRRGKGVSMPPFAQTLGMLATPDLGEDDFFTVAGALAVSIRERGEDFTMNFHPTFSNWLPFLWEGFTQTTAYTYAFENLSDLDGIWNGLDGSIRRAVRHAEKEGVRVRHDELPIGDLHGLVHSVMQEDGIAMPVTLDGLARLDKELSARGRRRVIHAEGPDGRLAAAAYVIHDETTAWYLTGGMTPGTPHTAAMSAVLWEAVRFAAGVVRRFDFEGSSVRSIERFFRRFGARRLPIFRIERRVRPDFQRYSSNLLILAEKIQAEPGFPANALARRGISSVVIYGFGRTGRILGAQLRDRIRIVAYLDRAANMTTHDGAPVVRTLPVLEPGAAILVSHLNGLEDEIVRQLIRDHPEARVVTLFELLEKL